MYSKPYTNEEEINAVIEVMRERDFSKFVGSPHENVKEYLNASSKDLLDLPLEKSFLGGKKVREFEAKWSELIGSTYSISVNSATSGLITALLSLPKDKRDEVITTPFSFTASAAAISLANYKTVFADIDIDTFCLCPREVKAAINKNTKAILYVSWCGNAGHLKEIKRLCQEYNLYLIEDASQSPTNKYQDKFIGTFGDIGVFSFNEPKNIMTGEGGMIVTENTILAERCRLIRNHGESIPDYEDTYLHDIMGYNFRLTEIQAAIGIVQLSKIYEINSIRKDNYNYLINNITITPQKITNSEYYPYTASFKSHHKDEILSKLKENNIPVASGIPRLLSQHPYYKNNKYCNNATWLQHQYLGFFQMGWPNTFIEMQKIVDAVKEAFK